MSTTKNTKCAHEFSAQLPVDSWRISTESYSTTYNGGTTEVERVYLQLTGTPDAFRYLSTLLLEFANRAEASAILDPADLKHLALTEWSAFEITCSAKPKTSRPQPT